MSNKSKPIVAKLQAQLQQAGWYELLKVFLVSSDFDDVVEQLTGLVGDGLRFTPPLRDVLRPFNECPPEKLRVVLLTSGPHPALGAADGLALSTQQPGRLPPSLYQVLTAVQQEFELDLPGTGDLSRWARQGVLLLNESLTTQLDREASHVRLWSPFLRYVLDRIATTYSSGVYWIFYQMDPYWESQAGPSNRCYYPQTPDELALALRAVNIRLGAAGHEPILW